MFSKACEYGIRAILFIVTKSRYNERTCIREIAKQIGAPEAFTAKVLQKLVKNDLLHSSTGPKGGFYLKEEEIERLKLIQVVKAIDGDSVYVSCGLGLDKCDAEHPCPVHYKFEKIRADLIEMLATMKVGKMAEDIENRTAFLKY